MHQRADSAVPDFATPISASAPSPHQSTVRSFDYMRFGILLLPVWRKSFHIIAL